MLTSGPAQPGLSSAVSASIEKLADAAQSLLEPRLKILVYHGVERTDPGPWDVSESDFCRQLDWLLERPHPVLRLCDALSALETGTLPERAVAITFDDAHASLAEVALPELRERDLPATVFVPTGWVGREDGFSGYDKRKRVLGWDELRALACSGMDSQSHTVQHLDLRELSDEALYRELADSRDTLAEEIAIPNYLAYPFGFVDPRVRRMAEAVGYRGGLEFGSTRGNWLGTPRFSLKREAVTTRTTMTEFRRKVDTACDFTRTLATRASRVLGPRSEPWVRGWVDATP
jgi:peptidoglycan/xylan/chitin deacetylase (PgdA/CDA1 family)